MEKKQKNIDTIPYSEKSNTILLIILIILIKIDLSLYY